MTHNQRETVAKAVGTLWAVSLFTEGKVREEVKKLADELDRMIENDLVGKEK